MKHKLSCLMTILALAIVFIPCPQRLMANEEIGFIETFALADDRADALKQLIPGTEDYYYFHALHAQNQGKHGEVRNLLEPWIKRYGETARVWEIRHREALLNYGKDPKASLDYLRHHLGLSFNHSQKRLNQKPTHPESLDPKLISWDAFLQRALRHSDTLSLVDDSGLDRIVRDDVELTEKRRRHLLSRLIYPDYPRLVGLIAADLRTKESRGFGEFQIHRNLLPAQLDELEGLRPELINDSNFVNTKIRKLHPNADVDWRRDAAEREAYLTRVWEFVKTLQPSFNSLKAHSLYQLLQHHQRKGDYPRDLFLTYVKLPRPIHYVEPKYLADAERRRFQVDLNANFQDVTFCPPIGNDEKLVRQFLLHFFVEDESFQAFEPFIRDTYLKPLFAESKLVNGIGDAERWFSMLSPSQVQALKDRVDIAFAVNNAEEFDPSDEVTLDVHLKNVGKLMVKVYEINALNFYLDQKRDLNTDLNLDGLIANEEKAYQYEDAPIRQVRRSFSFPSLAGKRGAWVIEFIGNGMSSRALVRKGRLQYLAQSTPAGTMIRVLTKENKPAKKPSVWFGGRQYQPEGEKGDGPILLPFSNQPGNQPIILADGDFASLEYLPVPAENYDLTANFHIDRENLLPGREVEIAVKGSLQVDGQPSPVSVLEDVKLVIRSTDLEGIESVEEVGDFKLFDDRESLHQFRVPERLVQLKVELRAKIEKLSAGGQKIDVADGDTFALNTIDQTEFVADVHLSRIGGRYVLEMLGKTGEPLPDRAVQVNVLHRHFTGQHGIALKTDEAGRVDLGVLEEIETIGVNGTGIPSRTWNLAGFDDSNWVSASVHGAAGKPIRIPFAGDAREIAPSDLVLLEQRGGTFVENAFAKVSLKDGLLEISGLARGDYELFLRGSNDKAVIRVTEATAQDSGYQLSQYRHLEVKNAAPLQITSIDVKGENITVSLKNADEFTRVHIAATRFLPEFPLDLLGHPNWSEPMAINRGTAESLYLSGRDIGEEYRYILERRASTRFPGNMLTRPALILNPWTLRDTQTTVDEAELGEEYEKMDEARNAAASRSIAKNGGRADANQAAQPVEPSLDFLGRQAPVVYNLAPDENGVVTFKRNGLGDRQHLHVLAINTDNAAFRQESLDEGEGVAIRDLRLTRNLDIERHFSQRQKVTTLQKGDALTIPDLRASELETYDTLASAYAAMAGLNGDGTFSEFSFILGWPDLDEAKKRELYSKYASHELNFFLSRRDPDFFQTVIQPYLENKKHKTFFDDYLIGSDLRKYTEPWAFGRLNIVERILLARRLGEDETSATARHVRELWELIPVDVEQDSRFFQSALRGRRTGGVYFGYADGGLGGGADPGKPMKNLARPGSGKDRDGLVRLSERSGAVREELMKLNGAILDKKAEVAMDALSLAEAPAPKSEPAAYEGRELQEAEFKQQMKGKLVDEESESLMSYSVAGKMRLGDLRKANKALFRKLESTKEWAENNYYHLPIEQQIADLVSANAYWRDYAAWDGKGGFYSREFPAATRSFAEMLLALAVLDVPFSAEEHDFEVEENTLTLTAASPVIIFHEEVEETPVADDRPPILVSQNFYRNGDRYKQIGNEQVDKFVTEEFLSGVLYGCQVVVTNPSSSSQRLDLLLQIPQGAMPAAGSDYTKTRHVRLEPFSTQKLDYHFYFPVASGDSKFAHYPVHVARDEEAIAWAEAFAFKVVDQLSTIDKASWDYLSQFGTEDEVIAFLEQNNVFRLNLGLIAWRCRQSADFFRRVTRLLDDRHRYDATLWSYGIYHNQVPVARQYLLHREDFLAKAGRYIECELVSIDPVARHWYQHLEYAPLVNARAHQLGRDRKILNDRFRQQYQGTMKVLSYRPEFDDQDKLATAYYLFLQDRIEEGLAWLQKVEAEGVDEKIQLDYLTAYASLFQEQPGKAANIAAKYADYPVDRWQQRFAQVTQQVEEIQGADPKLTEEENRDQQQDALAASEPGFELSTEGQTVTLDFQNLERVRVNYYEMDLEFLFSSNPFVSDDTSRFSFIRPNVTMLKDLPEGKNATSFKIPAEFASKNVLVEVIGAGRKRTAAVYANSLNVQLTENFGRIQVRHDENGKPMSKVYVKVYGRSHDGQVKFFKDGYTDLRGKFDYVSLNTNELDQVERLSLLVMSDENGALVREVAPPQR